jgi:hypothetical protein
MYWSRTGSYLDLAQWLLVSILASGGGWLVCRTLFRPRPRERIFLGIASGLLILTLASNLFALLMPLNLAFWTAALLIFAIGLVIGWRVRPLIKFTMSEFSHWQLYLLFGALFFLFAAINRGLAIFDDYSNLPLVSIIAAGDFPPRFYLNPEQVFSYHYGLHILAAGLVRVGGLFPWSAWDLYKALGISLTMMLGLLWFRRFMGWRAVLLLAGTLILFSGGTRWLLLFIPEPILKGISQNINMIGSGIANSTDLYSGLLSPWKAQGEGPISFPFAFVNGIYQPLIMAMGSSGAFPSMSLFLLLMLARRKWGVPAGLFFGLLVASISLFSESMYVVVLGGIILAVLIRWVASRSVRTGLSWGWTILPSILLIPVLGGVVSSLVQNLIGIGRGPIAQNTFQMALPAIALRWPPAILSAHLGELYINRPASLLVALAEMGPVILLAPIAIWASISYLRSGKLLMAGISLMTLPSFFIPILIRFQERDRDITRLIGSALGIWLVIGIPYIWLAFKRKTQWVSTLAILFCATAILGGVVLFSIQMISIPQTQPSYFIQDTDASMSRVYWNKLDREKWALDPNHPYRPTALFALTTGPAFQNLYIPLPGFLGLVQRLNPVELSTAGYTYLYLDRKTWKNLTAQQRGAIEEKCTRLIDEKKDPIGDFRRLYDISRCKSNP